MKPLENPWFVFPTIGFIATIAFWLYVMVFPVPFHHTDGDTATWIWLLRHGYNLYSPAQGLPMLQTNYPPLFLFGMANVVSSDHSILVTGSVFSLLSFLATAFLLGQTVARASQHRSAGIIAAFAFLSLGPIGYSGPACLSDGPALAVALLAVTCAARRIRGWPVLCAALFSISLLMKHSLIVFPVGVMLWALLRHTKQGILLSALTGFIVGSVVFGFDLFGPLVVWSALRFSWLGFFPKFAAFVLPLFAGFVCVVRILTDWRKIPSNTQNEIEPWLYVFAVSMVWCFALGRTGAGSNYVFELLCALTVLSTFAAYQFQIRNWFSVHLALSAFVGLIWLGHFSWNVIPKARAGMITAGDCARLDNLPILSEQSWYTTRVGRPPLTIPFLANQLARNHFFDDRELIDWVRKRKIGWLMFHFDLHETTSKYDSTHQERFSAELLETARSRYELYRQVGDIFIYKAKNQTP